MGGCLVVVTAEVEGVMAAVVRARAQEGMERVMAAAAAAEMVARVVVRAVVSMAAAMVMAAPRALVRTAYRCTGGWSHPLPLVRSAPPSPCQLSMRAP